MVVEARVIMLEVEVEAVRLIREPMGAREEMVQRVRQEVEVQEVSMEIHARQSMVSVEVMAEVMDLLEVPVVQVVEPPAIL